MTPDHIRTTVLRLLGAIAPEADLEALPPDESLRDWLDLDSMDFLNFVTAIDKELGVEIPEADYARLATLDGCIEYLLAAGAAGPRSGAG